MVVAEIKEKLATVDGKVDKVLALFEDLVRRHGRLEDDVKVVNQRLNDEVRRLEEKQAAEKVAVDSKIATINWRLAMGVGGISVLITIAPILMKLLGL